MMQKPKVVRKNLFDLLPFLMRILFVGRYVAQAWRTLLAGCSWSRAEGTNVSGQLTATICNAWIKTSPIYFCGKETS